jgi:hypothetical protein
MFNQISSHPQIVRRHLLISDETSNVVVEFSDIGGLYWMPKYLCRRQILLRKINHCCTSKGLEKASCFSQKPSRDCVLLWNYGYRFGTAILMLNSVCMVLSDVWLVFRMMKIDDCVVFFLVLRSLLRFLPLWGYTRGIV